MSGDPRKHHDKRSDEEIERELDEELEDTFPASDPPKVTRVPRDSQIVSDDEDEGNDDGDKSRP